MEATFKSISVSTGSEHFLELGEHYNKDNKFIICYNTFEGMPP